MAERNILDGTVSTPLILVVDDSPESLEVISTELIKYYEVHVATDGERCLELARRVRRPDLILLDVMMPGMDGPTLLAALRRIPETANIPAVFMTAKVQPVEVAELRSMGAAEVIAKPFDPMTLAEQIRTVWDRCGG